MKEQTIYEERLQAIALRVAGHSSTEVAKQLERTSQWVRKWWRRYQEKGVSGLSEQSRAPQQVRNKMPPEVREAVIKARLRLEAKAKRGSGLKYIGGQAVRTQLKDEGVEPLPSVPTIERILHQVGLTRKKAAPQAEEIKYPHLNPRQPHQLIQVDIVPHYLQGGQRVPCFNALDVVSRYPTGEAFEQRRSLDAAHFLTHLWQTVGIPTYTQVDNEGCFSGGTTHPYVLGRVVRLALLVGTELVFSPVYHPQSNGFVERFHQDYNQHVWDDTYLADFTAVKQQAEHFFALYRHSGHHSQLEGQTPHQCHFSVAPHYLPEAFHMGTKKLPLTTGKVHFIRQVHANGTVRVLNVDWTVPTTTQTGVWVTLKIGAEAAFLAIYDAAPDSDQRRCLASHHFPLKEAVQPFLSVDDFLHDPSDDSGTVQPHSSWPLQPSSSFDMIDAFFRRAILLAQRKLAKAFFRSDQLIE